MPYTLQLLNAPFGYERTGDYEMAMRDVLEAELGGADGVDEALRRDGWPAAPGSALDQAEALAWDTAFARIADWDSDAQAEYLESTVLQLQYVLPEDHARWVAACYNELFRLGALPSNAENIAAFAREMFKRAGGNDPVEVARAEWLSWPLDEAGNPLEGVLFRSTPKRLDS